MKRSAIFLILLLLAITAGCAKKVVQDLTPKELLQQGPEISRRRIANELNVSPESLVATEPVLVTGPLSGQYFFEQKFLEPKSGKVISVPLGRDLERYDIHELVEKERVLFGRLHGKLGPALRDSLTRLESGKRVRVAVWCPFPEISFPQNRGKDLEARKFEELRSVLESRLKELEQRLLKAHDSLVENLRRRGVPILYRSKYSPVVFCELNAEEIKSIADRKDVMQINLGRTYEEEHDSAIPTLRADNVHARGIDGDGVGVAICEDNRVIDTNPYLNVVDVKSSSISTDSHAAHTAGDAASSHSTLPGVAPGADIYSACAGSYDDDDIMEAIDWALSKGVRIINCSFGSDTDREMDTLDRYFDYVVRNSWVTITKSAGNRGRGDGDVTSPGLAWNVITVGGINDGGSSNWADDTMYSSSSYRDPISTHGDREKPEVCAVGQYVKSTTTSSPWVQSSVGGSGTSYAAPMVAGTAALVVDRNPSLAYWPEIIKALMMAGASHNIEGAQRLSDKDGAGAIDADRIDQMVSNGWYRGHRIEPGDFDASGDFSVSIPGVTAGQRIKAVICWDSEVTKSTILWWFTFYFDSLAADFDLKLYAPNGSYVTGSYSWDNSFEVIDVTAPQTGTYTLKIHKFRMDSSWEWLGVAWQR